MNMAVVVNNRWLQQNRDLAARFVKATQEAIESAVANPQAAADSFVRYVPDFDRGLALKEIQETIPLLRTPNSQGRPWGWTAEADWRSTLELLARFGGVQVKDLQTYYTNEFTQ
jgi:NitT/TauT family transport system substrate-binding protein